MAKIKVLDVAQEVGMEEDKLLSKLKGMGVKIKEKKAEESQLEEGLAADERIIERDETMEVVEKRVKPTVIRRRVRTVEPKTPPPEAEPEPPVEPAAETMPETAAEMPVPEAEPEEVKAAAEEAVREVEPAGEEPGAEAER
jgi:translation initiation factor IF-2